MKTLKKIYYKSINIVIFIFSFPSLLLHELCHSIAYFIVTRGIFSRISFYINYDSGEMGGESVHGQIFGRKNAIFVSIAPIIIPITYFILMILLNSELFCVLFIYCLITYETSLPSSDDIDNIKKYFKMTEKEYFDEEVSPDRFLK